MGKLLLAAVSAAVMGAAGAATDVTDTLEFVANPNLDRWTSSSQAKYRGVTALRFYRGRLFSGGGEVESNPGPVPIYSIDPYTKLARYEYSAGTEQVASFLVTSWGDLAVPSEDPHEGDPNVGHVFVRNPEGAWRRNSGIKFSTYRAADGKAVSYNTHSWDMVEHDGRVFVAGYGISASTDRLSTFSNATPTLSDGTSADTQTDPIEYVTRYLGGSAWHLLRQQHFLKIGGELFSVYNGYYQPNISNTNKKYASYNLGDGYWYDSATKKFVRIKVDLEKLYPSVRSADFALSMGLGAKNSSGQKCTDAQFVTRLRVWRPTPFAGRCLFVGSVDNVGYTAGSGDTYKYTSYPLPVGGFSATVGTPTSSYPHPVVSAKLDFGEETFPMDFVVQGGVCYALTTRFDATTQKVRHGIWKTTDALNFTEVASFDFHQNFITLERHDGHFYLGAGYKGLAHEYAYDSAKDEAGAIYRVADPEAAPLRVVAHSAAGAVAEGGSATVSFALASAPVSNVTVAVVADARHTVSLDRTSLVFTPANWSAPQPVTVTAQAIVDSGAIGVVCGVRDPSNARGEFESAEVRSACATVPVEVPAAVSGRWIFDSVSKTLTDRVWKFMATVSGTELTVGIPISGECPAVLTPLDFSKPVVDAADAGKSYAIATLNPSFCPNGGVIRPCAPNVGELTLPGEGLRKIAADAFSCCSNLCGDLTFPSSLTNVSAAAFKNTAVGSLDFLPAAADLLGGWQRGAFYSCAALGSVRFRAGGAYRISGGHTFAYATALTDADFSGVAAITVSSRGYAALGYCSALTNVVVDPAISLVNTTTNRTSGGTGGNALLYGNAALRSVHLAGAPTAAFDAYIADDGGYLYWVSSSQTVTTYVPGKCVEAWKPYAANGKISSAGTTFAADRLKSGISLSRRPLLYEGALSDFRIYVR